MSARTGRRAARRGHTANRAGQRKPAPTPKQVTPPRRKRRLPVNREDLSYSAALRRAFALCDAPEARELIKSLHERMRRSCGPKRQISVRVFIACCIANATLGRDPQAVIIRTFMASLPPGIQRQHHILGRKHPYNGHLITHRQIENMLVCLAEEMDNSRLGHNHTWLDADTCQVHPATCPPPAPTEDDLDEHGDPDLWVAGGDPLAAWYAEPRDCDDTCPIRQGCDWFFDRLLGVAFDVLGIPDNTVFALDSTHLTSHYRRLSWGAASDADLDSLEAQQAASDLANGDRSAPRFANESDRDFAARLYKNWQNQQAEQPAAAAGAGRVDARRQMYGPTVTGDITAIAPGWPRLGPDGRLRHTKDPDVTEGWHSGINGARSTTSPQRDIHVLTTSGFYDGDNPLPPFPRAFRMSKGGSHKGDAGCELVQSITAAGQKITDLQVDRGYTVTDADRFANPVRDAEIRLWLDLHPNQRKREDDINGILALDGSLFSSSLPERLRNLPALGRNATEAQRDASEALYNERAEHYGFSTLGKVKKDGSRRWQGPARTGRLRCPNYEPSKRLNRAKVPTSLCVEGEPCSCAKTITVPGSFAAKIRQDEFFGTTAWRKHYNRRNLVESGNAWAKYHFHLRRDSIRVHRDRRTHLHLGLWKVGILIEMARRWRLAEDTPDPQQHLDDDAANPPSGTDLDDEPGDQAEDEPERSGAPPG